MLMRYVESIDNTFIYSQTPVAILHNPTVYWPNWLICKLLLFPYTEFSLVFLCKGQVAVAMVVGLKVLTNIQVLKEGQEQG
jgi:hypothetical protein